MKRNESIERMKKQLDDWNAKIGEWEGKMQETQAGVKVHYAEQLEELRKQREAGMRKLKQVQESSEAAWHDMGKGFEDAWTHLAEGFENAWSDMRSKKNKDETKG